MTLLSLRPLRPLRWLIDVVRSTDACPHRSGPEAGRERPPYLSRGREANDKFDAMKKEGAISEDDHRRYREQTDAAVHEHSKVADDLIEQKSKQIQTI